MSDERSKAETMAELILKAAGLFTVTGIGLSLLEPAGAAYSNSNDAGSIGVIILYGIFCLGVLSPAVLAGALIHQTLCLLFFGTRSNTDESDLPETRLFRLRKASLSFLAFLVTAAIVQGIFMATAENIFQF